MVEEPQAMASVLAELEALLRPTEPRWAHAMARYRARLEGGEPVSDLARDVVTLYSAGMGGWNDVVLQDARGVLTEQREFHRLRTELFHMARNAT